MLLSILFKGNHTIALVKGLGDYETLKKGLKNVGHSRSFDVLFSIVLHQLCLLHQVRAKHCKGLL